MRNTPERTGATVPCPLEAAIKVHLWGLTNRRKAALRSAMAAVL